MWFPSKQHGTVTRRVLDTRHDRTSNPRVVCSCLLSVDTVVAVPVRASPFTTLTHINVKRTEAFDNHRRRKRLPVPTHTLVAHVHGQAQLVHNVCMNTVAPSANEWRVVLREDSARQRRNEVTCGGACVPQGYHGVGARHHPRVTVVWCGVPWLHHREVAAHCPCRCVDDGASKVNSRRPCHSLLTTLGTHRHSCS